MVGIDRYGVTLSGPSTPSGPRMARVPSTRRSPTRIRPGRAVIALRQGQVVLT